MEAHSKGTFSTDWRRPREMIMFVFPALLLLVLLD
jgi:hypothetical protein